jgi:hypothetical protein
VSVGAECGADFGAGSQQHLGKALLSAGEPRCRHGNDERRDDDTGVADRRTHRGDADRELLATVGDPALTCLRSAISLARSVIVLDVSAGRRSGNNLSICSSVGPASSAFPIAVQCAGKDTPNADRACRRCGAAT